MAEGIGTIRALGGTVAGLGGVSFLTDSFVHLQWTEQIARKALDSTDSLTNTSPYDSVFWHELGAAAETLAIAAILTAISIWCFKGFSGQR